MKIFTAAALALLLSSGMAIAQDNTQTDSNNMQDSGGSASDSDPNYLSGPTTQSLFTDDTRKSVRPSAEFKAAWDALNPADREDIKRACSANRDVSYNPLCTNAKGM